jgi:hypothetical protein
MFAQTVCPAALSCHCLAPSIGEVRLFADSMTLVLSADVDNLSTHSANVSLV